MSATYLARFWIVSTVVVVFPDHVLMHCSSSEDDLIEELDGRGLMESSLYI